jgi:hypothetical protein
MRGRWADLTPEMWEELNVVCNGIRSSARYQSFSFITKVHSKTDLTFLVHKVEPCQLRTYPWRGHVAQRSGLTHARLKIVHQTDATTSADTSVLPCLGLLTPSSSRSEAILDGPTLSNAKNRHFVEARTGAD